MKKCVVVCVMLLIVSGCWESFALIGGGAAGGMTVTRILDQQQKVLQEDIAMMEAQKAGLEQELATATDETEKQRISEQLDNVETVLADLRVTKESITKIKEGRNVNWSDPQSVIPFGVSVLMALLAERERRRKKEAATKAAAAQVKYQAHKQGVERTMKEVSASPNSGVKAIEAQLYANIGEARSDLGV